MQRDIRDRVEKLAPFLKFDADPYPVVARRPHACGCSTATPPPTSTRTRSRIERLSGRPRRRLQLRAQLGEGDGRRLRRHGQVLRGRPEGPDHPGVRGRRSPTCSPTSQDAEGAPRAPALPRGPVQGAGRPCSVATTSPSRRRFYDGSAKWLVSPDPGSGAVDGTDFDALTDAGSSRRRVEHAAAGGDVDRERIDPYYLYIKLPGEDSEHFIVLQPFVPVSSGNSQTRLVSFLTANSDPATTGAAGLHDAARARPSRARCRSTTTISRTAAISTAVTLLNQQGSQRDPGEHAADPGRQLDRCYVRPFYVAGPQSGELPAVPVRRRLQRRTSATVCAPTVSDGLDQLFGGRPRRPRASPHPGERQGSGTDADDDDHHHAAATVDRPRPGPRTTTTTTTAPGSGSAGPPQPGRRRGSTRPDGRAQGAATSASTSTLRRSRPATLVAAGPAAGARAVTAPELGRSGIVRGPGDCYYLRSGNPPAGHSPDGDPPGSALDGAPDGRHRHRSRQVQARLVTTAPTTTSTRPRRA